MENTIISTNYLEEAIKTAKEIIIRNNIDVPFDRISDIKVSGKIKKIAGKCKYNFQTQKYSINLAKHLFNTNKKLILEVLLHEFIHTIDSCFNHGTKFVQIMKNINNAENLDIRVSLNGEDIYAILEQHNAIKSMFKYKIVCAECGQVLGYVSRKSNDMVKNPQDYTCKDCGGKIRIIEL